MTKHAAPSPEGPGRTPGHGHGHGHGGGTARSLPARAKHLIAPHSHDTADKTDEALETSGRGLRVLGLSLVVLMFTAVAQAVIVAWSGSVALLGDTMHNVADALTAV